MRTLKDFLRGLGNQSLKKEILSLHRGNNYAVYSGYRKGDSEVSCTQEDFCKFLKEKLAPYTEQLEAKPAYSEMYQRICEGVFAPKLRTKENGEIPSSLHRKELCRILEQAGTYLPFLLEADAEGRTVSEKILAIFDYKLPYYVGPLRGARSWAVRKEEGEVLPWNLEEKIDMAKTEEGFIRSMTSLCTYTGEDVLPKDSLLYSEFTVRNEINALKVNGVPVSPEAKQRVFEVLFLQKDQRVTKKKIADLLVAEGFIRREDRDGVSGVDDMLKSSLTSYHKLKRIIPQVGAEMAEEIIARVVLFGEEKTHLKQWLREKTKLSEEDIRYVSGLGFHDWGRLSRTFLTGICEIDPTTGEAHSIMDCMRETGENLMQLLGGQHTFGQLAEEYRKERLGVADSPMELVQDLYVSPKIRRSIWQTLNIVDEIVDTQGAAPKKIFIEVARDQDDKNEKKRTDSRKERLLDLYRKCGEECGDLFGRLQEEDESRLRRDKLYLYYAQFGRCAYSGEVIDIERLEENGLYDIDHIFPRSRIKDDSLENRVLVLSRLNREKSNLYPISDEIRAKMAPQWKLWFDRGMMTRKKYERLTRNTPLTEEELTAFVDRQLVETRQSTKALAELLKQLYPKTKIVYSKAGNVSDFRNQFGFLKCREVNDLHHANDAYLNIVVGNYFDTRFTDEFLHNITRENYSLRPDVMYTISVPGAWIPGEDGTIATVRRVMAKHNILYTRQPTETRGQLYDVTILKAGKGQIPIKAGMDIERYGGYNRATGAYFTLIERTEKKKRVRSIETVLLCDKAAFERDPAAYAKAKWGEDAEVILPKIHFSALLEYNQVRYHLAGRNDDKRLRLNLAYQLYLNQEDILCFRRRAKYLERCQKERREVPRGAYEDFTVEENLRLWDLLTEKASNPPYCRCSNFRSMADGMRKTRKTFAEMPIIQQCRNLIELLKEFHCNAQEPQVDGLAIGGLSRITVRKKDKISLIHQSVTGLYETKVDLWR